MTSGYQELKSHYAIHVKSDPFKSYSKPPNTKKWPQRHVVTSEVFMVVFSA